MNFDMEMMEFNLRKGRELAQSTGTPKDRIRARCIQCIYDPRESGSALEQITACTKPSCSLFDLRPRVKGGKVYAKTSVENKTPLQAIRGECTNCCYDPGQGNGSRKHQVSECVDKECALWSVRNK